MTFAAFWSALRDLGRGLNPGPLIPAQPQRQLPCRERAELAQKIRHTLNPACPILRPGALKTLLNLKNHLRIQQIAQLSGTQQLRQKRRIQCQGGSAAFGGGRIRIVNMLRHVLKKHGAGKRRRPLGLHLRQADAPRGNIPMQLKKRRNIIYILQAFAGGFQQNWELGVFARNIQQLGRTLALLP